MNNYLFLSLTLLSIFLINFYAVNNASRSSIDELEDFAMGQVHNNASKKANVNTGEIKQNLAAKTNRDKGAPAARTNKLNDVDDLESFFSMGSRSSSVPKSRAATMVKVTNIIISNDFPTLRLYSVFIAYPILRIICLIAKQITKGNLRHHQERLQHPLPT